MPIIDLGCGIGNDTLYLKTLGKKVVSIDYSDDALRILKQNIDDAFTIQMDFKKEKINTKVHDKEKIVWECVFRKK